MYYFLTLREIFILAISNIASNQYNIPSTFSNAMNKT